VTSLDPCDLSACWGKPQLAEQTLLFLTRFSFRFSRLETPYFNPCACTVWLSFCVETRLQLVKCFALPVVLSYCLATKQLFLELTFVKT
jgi:hypothetical protein